MATLNRRRFMLLSAVALIGAACSSTEAAGLRGNGRTFVPREETQPAAPEPTPSLRPAPPLVPTPAVREPILAPDAPPPLSPAHRFAVRDRRGDACPPGAVGQAADRGCAACAPRRHPHPGSGQQG